MCKRVPSAIGTSEVLLGGIARFSAGVDLAVDLGDGPGRSRLKGRGRQA